MDFAFCYFDMPGCDGSPEYRKTQVARLYATSLVQSIYHFHPQARIIQLTDHKTNPVSANIETYRLDVPIERPNLARMYLYAAFPVSGRMTAYVDADMMLTRPFNVEPIAPQDNTVILCERTFKRGFVQSLTVGQLGDKRYEHFDNQLIEDVMPYLACFAMASSNAFWAECLVHMNSLPDDLQAWFGDQLAMRVVAASDRFNIRILHENQVAYPVSELDGPGDPRCSAFAHFKGNSKNNTRFLQHYLSIYRP